MFVETFLACFRQFYFLNQTEYFAWAIAFALWPFLAIFEMLVETFLTCFGQFYFLTQTEYFAWVIAFALWPFLAILKMLSFFEY